MNVKLGHSISLKSSIADTSHQDVQRLARRAPDALLWQYYLRQASRTISTTDTDPRHTKMWESSVPTVGFSNALVSHAIMAFSAFCMSSKPGAETASYDFRTTGQLHYYQALKQMQASLPFLGRDNADAVLACAMVLIPCGLALAHGGESVERSDDWLHHLRGFRTLGAAIYQGEKSTDDRLVPYPQQGIPDSGMKELVVGNDAIFLPPLLACIRRSWRDALGDLNVAVDRVGILVNAVDRKTHLAAIKSLEYAMNYTLCCKVPNLFRAVFTWPILLSSHFCDLVARRDHLALAIYSHWLVLTMLVEDKWWIGEFGSERIEATLVEFRRVESSFIPLLEWPVRVLTERRALKVQA
jgi:hypothetical protein